MGNHALGYRYDGFVRPGAGRGRLPPSARAVLSPNHGKVWYRVKRDFTDRYSGLEGPVHALDPRSKILALLALAVICVATPPDSWWAFTVYAALIVVIATASRLPFKFLASRLLVVLPFVVAVAVSVPFLGGSGPTYGLGLFTVTRGGALVLWNFTVKSVITVLCLVILSSTTPFFDMMHGLERLRVPRFLIRGASSVHRRLSLAIEEARRMRRARAARNGGRRLPRPGRAGRGRALRVLLLRSRERSAGLNRGMTARGFDGSFPALEDPPMEAPDYLFLAMVTATAVAGRLVVLWR